MEKVFDHLGIAVENIEKAIPSFESLFGKISELEVELLSDQDLTVAFLKLGGLSVELLQPNSSKSPISKFIKKRGPGIHHVAWKVENIDEAFNQCIDNDLRVLSEAPYKGARNKLVFFVHPKDSSGVLMEFCSSS